jgi:hypothetical protein
MYIISFDEGKSLLYTLLEEVAEETAAAICTYMKTDVKVSRGGKVVHEFFAKESVTLGCSKGGE